mmetsp:Transcript_22016/g.55522  ORF Transcript_22016/g.55522 Transcript_22016/m.55522 type:complete len:252 (-) Transcript_22016:286-1041(-)
MSSGSRSHGLFRATRSHRRPSALSSINCCSTTSPGVLPCRDCKYFSVCCFAFNSASFCSFFGPSARVFTEETSCVSRFSYLFMMSTMVAPFLYRGSCFFPCTYLRHSRERPAYPIRTSDCSSHNRSGKSVRRKNSSCFGQACRALAFLFSSASCHFRSCSAIFSSSLSGTSTNSRSSAGSSSFFSASSSSPSCSPTSLSLFKLAFGTFFISFGGFFGHFGAAASASSAYIRSVPYLDSRFARILWCFSLFS